MKNTIFLEILWKYVHTLPLKVIGKLWKKTYFYTFVPFWNIFIGKFFEKNPFEKSFKNIWKIEKININLHLSLGTWSSVEVRSQLSLSWSWHLIPLQRQGLGHLLKKKMKTNLYTSIGVWSPAKTRSWPSFFFYLSVISCRSKVTTNLILFWRPISCKSKILAILKIMNDEKSLYYFGTWSPTKARS